MLVTKDDNLYDSIYMKYSESTETERLVVGQGLGGGDGSECWLVWGVLGGKVMK